MANRAAMARERERVALEKWERERAEYLARPRCSPILAQLPWRLAETA